MRKAGLAILLVVGALGATADAQLHGMGRIQGTVADETGAPLTDVSVKATLPGSSGSIDGSSDKKGQWVLGGLGRGEWDVVFAKPGYVARRAKVSLLVELSRIPAVTIVLKKGA